MPISVVLEVLSGPLRGKKVRLGSNQTLTVGRTERADFVNAADPRMSARHFTLETDRDACRLTDLQSANGTFINDERVETAEVRDGDRIRAADTNFAVQIAGAKAGDSTAPRVMRPAFGAAPPPATAKSSSGLKVEYAKEVCNSGVTRYRGGCEQVPAVEIARRLAQLFPLWTIVDFAKLCFPKLEEVKEPKHILDWLPAPVANRSPIIVGRQDVQDLFSIIDRGWSKGGLSCWFTKLPPQDAVERLRKSARINDNTVLGYWSPNVLGLLLAHSLPDFTGEVMKSFDAVLVEPHDKPKNWQLFSYQPLDEVLKGLGFEEAAPPPAQ